MRARDRDPGATGHAGAERFRVRQHAESAIDRFEHHRVVRSNRRRCEHDVALFRELVGAFVEADIDPELDERLGDRRGGRVASSNTKTGTTEHARQCRHAAPADPDHVWRDAPDREPRGGV